MKDYERLAQPLSREALLDRKRWGEAELCQFPDSACNAPRHRGTHFCEGHIAVMRERACEEIRADYGICDPTDWEDVA